MSTISESTYSLIAAAEYVVAGLREMLETEGVE